MAAQLKVDEQATVVAAVRAELTKAAQRGGEVTKGLIDAPVEPTAAPSKVETTLREIMEVAMPAISDQLSSLG